MGLIANSSTFMKQADEVLSSSRPDMRRYIALTRRAAAGGNPRAQESLAAWCLEGLKDRRGWIVRRSPATAIPLLKAAADAGNEHAMFSLANCYADGVGVRQDVQLARRLYLKAYRRGFALAAMNLSVLCKDNADHRGELRWLKRAAKCGEDDAVIEVARRMRRPLTDDLVQSLRRVARYGPPDLRPEARRALRGAGTKTARGNSAQKHRWRLGP